MSETVASISLRDAFVGGILCDPAINPPDLFTKSDRVLLLVHGFNVTQAEAERSYALFERQLGNDVKSQVVRLFWPGDTSTAADSRAAQQGMLSRCLSGAAYSWKPPMARQSAQKLRSLFKIVFRDRAQSGRNRPLELGVVAHSLGCRLTLEMLERVIVAQGRDVHMPLTVLMAAAVPEYMVTGNGALAFVINELPEVWILHSRADKVLRDYFRPGQLFERAGIPNLRFGARRALGRKGMPAGQKIKVLEGTWDHSDYWPDREVAHAVDAALSHEAREAQPFETLTRTVWERSVQARTAERREIREHPTLW